MRRRASIVVNRAMIAIITMWNVWERSGSDVMEGTGGGGIVS